MRCCCCCIHLPVLGLKQEQSTQQSTQQLMIHSIGVGPQKTYVVPYTAERSKLLAAVAAKAKVGIATSALFLGRFPPVFRRLSTVFSRFAALPDEP